MKKQTKLRTMSAFEMRSLGGKARAKALSDARRKEIASEGGNAARGANSSNSNRKGWPKGVKHAEYAQWKAAQGKTQGDGVSIHDKTK